MSDGSAGTRDDGSTGRRDDVVSRAAATLLLALAGLGFAWAHWLGLVAGAALVSLPQRTVVRGVAAGVTFGLLAAVANVALVATAGGTALTTSLGMGQVLAVSVVVPLVAGLVGGLVGLGLRGVGG